jgi:hypothetical protein
VRDLLGGPVELAFLDGMHLFEYLLRDFINTERCCGPGSLIVLHDCIPLDLPMTVRDAADAATRSRSRYPQWWTEDVWKLVRVLQLYRPDLAIEAFNAPPTGLVLVGNLDPASRVLDACYDEVVTSFSALADEAATLVEYLSHWRSWTPPGWGRLRR